MGPLTGLLGRVFWHTKLILFSFETIQQLSHPFKALSSSSSGLLTSPRFPRRNSEVPTRPGWVINETLSSNDGVPGRVSGSQSGPNILGVGLKVARVSGSQGLTISGYQGLRVGSEMSQEMMERKFIRDSIKMLRELRVDLRHRKTIRFVVCFTAQSVDSFCIRVSSNASVPCSEVGSCCGMADSAEIFLNTI